MLNKLEIKKWLLENCVSENGDLDLRNLDFSDFEGNVLISGMEVKGDLWQSDQEVQGSLYQANQKVQGSLYQQCQHVNRNLWQDHQKVQGCLYVGENIAKEMRRFSKKGLVFAKNLPKWFCKIKGE